MTFLEIMIVIVILGVLITVTAARLKGTSQRAALLGATREIVGGFNAARQAAISTHRDVWLKFDVNKDRWWINLNVAREEEDRHAHFDRNARYSLEIPHELPPKVSFIEATTGEQIYPEDENERDRLPVIVFHADGSASGGHVVLENENKRQMTVEVAQSTGRVEAYVGKPRTFVEKLKALGVDPSAFATPEEIAAAQGQPGGTSGQGNPADPNAERSARESQQRQQYYADVLSRILDARRQAQQIQQPRTQPPPETRTDNDRNMPQ